MKKPFFSNLFSKIKSGVKKIVKQNKKILVNSLVSLAQGEKPSNVLANTSLQILEKKDPALRNIAEKTIQNMQGRQISDFYKALPTSDLLKFGLSKVERQPSQSLMKLYEK